MAENLQDFLVVHAGKEEVLLVVVRVEFNAKRRLARRELTDALSYKIII